MYEHILHAPFGEFRAAVYQVKGNQSSAVWLMRGSLKGILWKVFLLAVALVDAIKI